MGGDRRGARTRAVAGAALTVVVTFSACSGPADEPTAPAPRTPSESPASPAPTTGTATDRTVPPPPELPHFRPGPKGQRAFAGFVRDAWSWSLVSNDAAPLLRVSPSKKRACDGCRALERELRSRDRAGWFVDFPGLDPGATKVRRDGDVMTATTRVTIPESETYFEDGRFRSTNPQHARARFVVEMRRTASGYRLLSFRVA
jgi:hypothetical protein